MDQSLVTKMRKGTRNVGLAFARHIQRRTGIPMEAWLSDATDESGSAKPRNGRKSLSDKASKAHANG